MRMSSAGLLLFVLTTAAWLLLGLWRKAGVDQMKQIERAYLAHYQEHGSEAPVVEWSFEEKKLVEIPESDIQEREGSGGLSAVAVRSNGHDAPMSAYGLVLARIPALWFHGLFGLMLVISGALALFFQRG